MAINLKSVARILLQKFHQFPDVDPTAEDYEIAEEIQEIMEGRAFGQAEIIETLDIDNNGKS